MKSNKHAKREAKELFRLCLVNDLLDENRTRQVVKQVVASGYRDCSGHPLTLPAAGEARPRAAHGERRERHALAEDLRSAIGADLTRRYGEGLVTRFIRTRR